jgi:3-dehydroquinate synthase
MHSILSFRYTPSTVSSLSPLQPLHIPAPPSTSSPCSILVSPGLLSQAGTLLRQHSKSAKALIVTDSTVGPLHLAPLEASLRSAGFTPITHTLPAGEKHKHLLTLLPAYETFLAAEIDRQTPLLALGGGVTGDMAGLLAATLLRGLPFVQIPTTLMAMVDSAIGGKTAVNQPGETGGKNLVGAFHQPLLVLSDPNLLLTLPVSELSNGLAECIKHDAIRDAAHLRQMFSLIPRVLAKDLGTLTHLAHHNAAIKASVVTDDPHERGVRAHLNFGHTFAHAIELVTHHAIPHGAAVALGMAAAAHLSTNLNLLTPQDRDLLIQSIQQANLPTTGLTTSHDALLTAMRKDKKVEHGALRFIVLEALGKPVIRNDITPTQVRQALQVIT